MVKTTPPRPPDAERGALRLPAEELYAAELEALRQSDTDPRPTGWLLSPRAVRTYLLGGQAGGVAITPKYVGKGRLVEIAITTLATDRALLLIGFQIVLSIVLSPLADWIQGFVSNIVSGTLTAPFIALVLTLLYFRLRAAREQAAAPPPAEEPPPPAEQPPATPA